MGFTKGGKMNKLALALASSAVAVAMADDPGNINFAEPREATYTNFNDNGGSTFTSYTPQTYSAPQPQFYDANAAAGFNAGLNTPLGGFNGGVSVGQPSSLFSMLMQFIGKVTSLNIFEKLFGKDEASRMARALLANVSADDINEYTHMAVAAFDKFGEMNNMPK